MRIYRFLIWFAALLVIAQAANGCVAQQSQPRVGFATDYNGSFSRVEAHTKGVYAMWPVYEPIPATITSNPGLVGIYIQIAWRLVQPSSGSFDWSKLDARIREAEASNMRIILSIRDDLIHAPADLIADPRVGKTTLVMHTPVPTNPINCQKLVLPLFWDPTYQAARERLIRAMGQRYANDPAIVGVTVAFANANTDDWGVPHEDRRALRAECGIDFDNQQEWLQAGYSNEKMLDIGKDLLDTTASAFPRRELDLPIGIHGRPLRGAELLDQFISYGRKRYSDRFYVQMNRLDSASPVIDDPQVDASAPYGPFALYQHLKQNAPFIGLQMLAAASNGAKDHCTQNHHDAPCPPREVMRKSLDIALSYHPAFVEVWDVDAQNSELASLLTNATLRTGGQLRGLHSSAPRRRIRRENESIFRFKSESSS
jgi:hypothetical protein